jgi:hypothetical protein
MDAGADPPRRREISPAGGEDGLEEAADELLIGVLGAGHGHVDRAFDRCYIRSTREMS